MKEKTARKCPCQDRFGKFSLVHTHVHGGKRAMFLPNSKMSILATFSPKENAIQTCVLEHFGKIFARRIRTLRGGKRAMFLPNSKMSISGKFSPRLYFEQNLRIRKMVKRFEAV